MADIFLSYKSEDFAAARRIVNALQAQGWSVWWDDKIRAGERWDQLIEKELKEATCVVVVWSRLSVSSRWVRDEAHYAVEQNTYVPVRIDDTSLPLGFGPIQARDLSQWSGDLSDGRFLAFLDAVALKIRSRSSRPLSEDSQPRVPLAPVWAAAAAAIVAWSIFIAAPILAIAAAHVTDASETGTGPGLPTRIWLLFFTHESYFWFGTLFLPISVFLLARGIGPIWREQLSSIGRIVLPIICVGLAAGFTYFENFDPEAVQVPNIAAMKPAAFSEVFCNGTTGWQHLRTSNPACREAFSAHAQNENNIAPLLQNSIILGIFGLYVYWISYVATLGIATFGPRPWTIDSAAPKILLSGAVAFTWFVFYAPYLLTKKELLGYDNLEAGIYVAFLIVGLFYYSWGVLHERYLSNYVDKHKISIIFWSCFFLVSAFMIQNFDKFGSNSFLRKDMPENVLIGIPAFVIIYMLSTLPLRLTQSRPAKVSAH